MKNCDQCHALNEENAVTCAVCGAELIESEAAEVAEAAEEITEAAAEETEAAAEKTGRKLSKGAVIGIAVAVVAVLAAVIVGITALNKEQEPADAPSESVADAETAVVPSAAVESGHHVNAYGLPSHSIHYAVQEDGTTIYSFLNQDGETVAVPQEEVDALMEQEVASCADMTIQNSDFMFYYNEQLYQFTNVYSAYLSFMMNQQQALDEQMNMDGVYTWEQTFVDASLRNFQRLAALKAHAEAEGYVLPESEQARVETLKADLEAMGQSYGFADATEYLQATFGPAATFEAYLDFYTANVYVSSYLAKVQSETSCTDAELEAYYEENAQMLTESYGIEKIDRNVVAARHILIQPESTVAEDGTESISDEAWAAAEAEAQRIYEEWLAGEATEETFAELAGTYTQDPGSQATGGLYEDIYPGQMVPEFNDWCFADGRAVGDHGVVKTSYGYHIMFFAGEGDYIYWKMAVADMVVSDKVNDFIANLCAGCELTSDASKVVLLNAIAPTAPAAEAETETQTEAQ